MKDLLLFGRSQTIIEDLLIPLILLKNMRRYGRPEDSPFTQSHFDLKVKQLPTKSSFLEFSARNP